MKCPWLFAIVPVVLVGADAPKGDAVKKELAKFRGTWQLVSSESNGKKMADEECKRFRQVFNEGKRSYFFGEIKTAEDRPFDIDPTVNPKWFTETLPNGVVFKSIYELDGDTLKLCGVAPGIDRPKKFTGKAGVGQTLSVYRRVKATAAWKPLFDGKTLAGWKAVDFTDAGKVHVKDGDLIMEKGSSMTGVTYTGGDFPKVDYEVSVEAERVAGGDFFGTMIFPVEDTFCSFVVGGWGGTIVGLSNVNHDNASQNMTTTTRDFDSGKWYKLRLRVTKDRIKAWIDDDVVVDLETTDRKIDLHRSCEPCKPFGLATWKTTGAVRAIRVRTLTEAEKK